MHREKGRNDSGGARECCGELEQLAWARVPLSLSFSPSTTPNSHASATAMDDSVSSSAHAGRSPSPGAEPPHVGDAVNPTPGSCGATPQRSTRLTSSGCVAAEERRRMKRDRDAAYGPTTPKVSDGAVWMLLLNKRGRVVLTAGVLLPLPSLSRRAKAKRPRSWVSPLWRRKGNSLLSRVRRFPSADRLLPVAYSRMHSARQSLQQSRPPTPTLSPPTTSSRTTLLLIASPHLLPASSRLLHLRPLSFSTSTRYLPGAKARKR